MNRLTRRYGAHPLHLLAVIAAFGLAGYAALRLVPSDPIGVAVWIGAAVVGHDLLLLPLYAVGDRCVLLLLRRFGGDQAARWIVHLRVPALLSGVLLIVFIPSMLRMPVYFDRWMAITAVLFASSAFVLLIRLLHRRLGARTD